MLIGHYADRKAAQPGRAADHRLAVFRLVLVEGRRVENRRQHVPHFVVDARVGTHQAIQIAGRPGRFDRRDPREGGRGQRRIGGDQSGQAAQPLETGLVVRISIIDRAADLGMHQGPAQILAGNLLADRAFDQRRTGQIQARSVGHQQLVAEHRQIAAAGHAIAHDGGDLAQAGGRNDRVVAKNPAEIVLVGKDVLLQRQEHAGRVDQVDERQPVLHGDPLGPKHLLGRRRKEGPGLHRGVVGDDHLPPAGHDAHAADDPRRGCAAPLAVHLPAGPEADFQPGRVGIQQPPDPLSGRQSALGMLPVDGRRAAAQLNAERCFLKSATQIRQSGV